MPLPVPDGVEVHQAASLLVVHAELEVTLKPVIPAGAVTFWFAGVTAKVGAEPDWETVTVTAGIPVTVTVTVATREVGIVLAINVAMIVPLPVPEGVTVHHAELLVTTQAALEVTVKLAAKKSEVSVTFPETEAAYVRLLIFNRGKCPDSLPSAGKKAWLFVDEITVE